MPVDQSSIVEQSAAAIVVSAILGVFGFARTRASRAEVAESIREIKRAHRRLDLNDVNQAVIITTLNGIAKNVGAAEVPERALRRAEIVSANGETEEG